MINLIKAGFTGSANALLRQCYEFLCWSKLAVDNEDVNVLKRLHDSFYNEGSRADSLNTYLKKIKYTVDDENYIESNIIQAEGKDIFCNYSFFTHASGMAQQYPLKSEDFYEQVSLCCREITLWIICLCEIEIAYLEKCLRNKSTDSIELIMLFCKFNMTCEQLRKTQYKLEKIFPELNSYFIYDIFKNTKWIIE